MAIGRLRIALLVVLTSMLSAVEISGAPPAFLTTMLTPTWRLTPVGTVLDHLARDAKITITRTDGVTALAEQPLLLVSPQAMTCQAVLETLERCADVRFTVAKDGVRVERISEYIRRRTEVRWYPMSEYGLVEPARDAVGQVLGFPGNHLNGVGIDLNGARATEAAAYDPEMLVEYLRYHVSPTSWENEGVGIEQRSGNLAISQTPENHERIRETLIKLRERLGRPRQWQVTFGLLAKDERLPTGIMQSADARRVAARLTGTATLTLSGLPHQRMHAAKLDEQSHILAIDVVNHHLDPRIRAVATGRSATLDAIDGQQGTLVEIRLGWVEELGKPAPSVVSAPAQTLPTTTTTRTADGVQTSTTTAPTTAGEQVPLQHPVLWTWQPALELLLPTDHALVLSSEHPSGQAVMLLEKLP